MKVAHFAQFAPNQCGLYATARDLVLAERLVGINAGFIDSRLSEDGKTVIHKCGLVDGAITTFHPDWARDADAILHHSILPPEFVNLGIPLVMCLHGRPESSFLLEKYGKTPVWSSVDKRADDDRYKAHITFWERYLPYWGVSIPKEKLAYIPAMVNLDEFTPDGPKMDMGKHAGTPNILIADIWREDITPFQTLFAAVRYVEEYCPTARIHLFGIATKKPCFIQLVLKLRTRNVLGHTASMIKDMAKLYRACDIVVTPHNIATRIVRESLACGRRLVAGTGNPYTPFTADPRDIPGFAAAIDACWKAAPYNTRGMAESHFGLEQAGRAMANLLNKVAASRSAVGRTGVINELVKTHGYKTYLEIGVRNPGSNFDKIQCAQKDGIDPKGQCNYVMTSDEFFDKHKDKRYDLVFIDGLHRWWQVLRDVQNSLLCLNDGGAVVLHDCSPETAEYAKEDGEYCASVWKAWAILRMTRPDLEMRVYDTDHGVGVITRGRQELFPEVDVTKLTYDFLAANRSKLLNLGPCKLS